MFNKITNNWLYFLFKNKLNKFEKIYILVLIALIIFSFFVIIPSDQTDIGISSGLLDLGDRGFYINNHMKRGYGDADSGGYYGNILYPVILKIITFVSMAFGQSSSTKLWNLITILISSSLSIITLILLRKSTYFIFKKEVSEIACLIYILNPYSYYFPLSGGITNYVLCGVTYLLFIFSYSFGNKSSIAKNNLIRDLLCINFGCIYLSSLRPTAGILSLTILIFFLYKSLSKFFRDETFNRVNLIKIFINLIGIIFVTYNIFSTLDYSIENVSIFSNEGGTFFGYPRNTLRDILSLSNENIFLNLKHLIYIVIWKVIEFFSGLSDIRDTYAAPEINKLLPFLMRTFTGIFYLFPVNLFSFIGILIYRRLILISDLWILLLACLLALSPSFIGTSMSRYLIMFHTPFLMFAAKSINNLTHPHKD